MEEYTKQFNEGTLENYKKSLHIFLVLVPLQNNYADVTSLRRRFILGKISIDGKTCTQQNTQGRGYVHDLNKTSAGGL